MFKRKTNSSNCIELAQYKARLVAQVFSQQKGLDYDEIVSPVIRFESVRKVSDFISWMLQLPFRMGTWMKKYTSDNQKVLL